MMPSLAILTLCFAWIAPAHAEDLLMLDNGRVKVGIDREKGASITWLSWSDHPKNIVNLSDPGRLIQQSYYAGQAVDRIADGQSKAWSPWTWNPIQGGGISSWARVNVFDRLAGEILFAETVPKLWDMPNEEAAAIMRQWTAFEPEMPNVIVVRCEFESNREENDRWGPAVPRHQEVPACYFTRNFDTVKSYLGNGKWREETQTPGPPWGHANAPRKAMALFDSDGAGVAVFSPASTLDWNFGPHGTVISDDPTAEPCMHVAPLDQASLGPQSVYRFRYWLVIGNQEKLEGCLDVLWEKYSGDHAEVIAR
jgi:hypothetical protein